MTNSARSEAVDAANALRSLLIAGEQFRRGWADHLDISVSEAASIVYLSHDPTITPRQLADRLGVTPSAITAILDKLESRGYIAREKHPTDRRQLVITLTRQGRSALNLAARHLAAAAATPDPDGLIQTCEVIRDVTARLQRRAAILNESSKTGVGPSDTRRPPST